MGTPVVGVVAPLHQTVVGHLIELARQRDGLDVQPLGEIHLAYALAACNVHQSPGLGQGEAASLQLLLELAAHQALDVADEKAKGVRLFVHDMQPI